MKLQAYGNRIIAKQVEIEKTSSSSIILSSSKQLVGEIVSMGKDVKGFFDGDKVMYLENIAFDFMGERFVTFTDDKIIGKVVE